MFQTIQSCVLLREIVFGLINRRRARVRSDQRRSRSTTWSDLTTVSPSRQISLKSGSCQVVAESGRSGRGRGAGRPSWRNPRLQELCWHRLSSVFRRGCRKVFETWSWGQSEFHHHSDEGTYEAAGKGKTWNLRAYQVLTDAKHFHNCLIKCIMCFRVFKGSGTLIW